MAGSFLGGDVTHSFLNGLNRDDIAAIAVIAERGRHTSVERSFKFCDSWCEKNPISCLSPAIVRELRYRRRAGNTHCFLK